MSGSETAVLSCGKKSLTEETRSRQHVSCLKETIKRHATTFIILVEGNKETRPQQHVPNTKETTKKHVADNASHTKRRQ